MSWTSEFGDFIQSMYRSSTLKNRIVIWTFLVLVLPASFISALGVPLKITAVVVAALILPVQIGVFTFWRRERTAPDAHAVAVERLLLERYALRRAQPHNVITHPDFDHMRVEDLIRQLKLLRMQGGNLPQSKASLIPTSEHLSTEHTILDALGSGAGLIIATEIVQRASRQRLQTMAVELPLGSSVRELSSAPAVAPV